MVHTCRCPTRISFRNVFEACKPGIKNKKDRLTQIDSSANFALENLE